jgi:hypothetical protein
MRNFFSFQILIAAELHNGKLNSGAMQAHLRILFRSIPQMEKDVCQRAASIIPKSSTGTSAPSVPNRMLKGTDS